MTDILPGRRLLLAIVLIGYAVSGTGATLDQARWNAVGAEVLAAAEQERAAHHVPSIALGLVDRSGLVWAGALGPADAEGGHLADAHTLYRIGSVSKLFTDILVMQLVEQGTLDLDAPVNRYLLDFSPSNPFGQPITLRQLMTHHSGLVREPPVGNYFDARAPSLEDTVRSLNSTSLVAAPGTITKYSNAGVGVVGRVLEVVTGKRFEQLVENRILEPLAMTGTALRATPDVRHRLAHAQMAPYDASRFAAPVFDFGAAPAGNLYSNIEDMARFAAALLNAGKGRGGRILERATLQEMWEPQSGSKGGRSFGIGFALGSLDGHRVVGHTGSVYGYVADLSVFPDDGFAVIVAIALDDAAAPLSRLRTYAARQILAAQAGKAPLAYEKSEAVPTELARKVEGYYSDGSQSLHIRRLAGRVYLEAPGVVEELRMLHGRWVLDGTTTFREDISIKPDTGEVTLGSMTYRRRLWTRPEPPPAEFASLIGEYGWEHNYLQVYERDGRPYVRIEWTRYEPLERVSRDVFRFADPQGLYGHEELRFTRDEKGDGERVSLNGIVFERRDFGAETERKVRAGVRSDADRRARAIAARPPALSSERAPDLVEIVSVEPGIKLDMRYASTNNFMGMRFYESARAFLQRPAVEALARVHRSLRKKGYGIVVHDGYRPWYVTKMFWEATPEGNRDFVADPAEGSRHNRGSAADVTLYELSSGRMVSMPGRYDEMSARSYSLYVGGTSLERWRRDMLKEAMEAEGFDVYPYEWWHFDFKDWESYPLLNVDFSDIPAG